MTKHFKIHPTEELFEDYINEENTIGYPRVDYIEEDKKIWRSRITPKIDHSREYLTFRTVNGAKWESLLFFIPSEISTDYVRSISYSIDNGESWITTNNVDEESIQIEINSAPLGKVLVKGDADQYGVYLEEDEYTIWCSFGSEQLFNVSGNIMSLFYGDNFIGKTQFPEESSYNCYYLFSWDYENWEYICNIKHASGLVLPSMELTECCYEEMFYECDSLVDVPELPATTLATYCYSSMFSGCTSLVKAPELPSTTLAESCYSGMFSNCTSLTSAPELPATTLANWCYSSMFSSCISLTTAPDLPAIELKEQCYSNMFYGCSSLTVAPELPATTLADSCYSYMFQECTSLNYIKALFIELPSTKYTNRWVKGVNKRGIFVQNGSALWWLMGHSGIPNLDWTLQYEGESTTAENAKVSALGEAFTIEIESKMSIAIIIPPQIQKYHLDWIAYSIDNGDTWNTVQNTSDRSENIYFGTTKAVEPGKKVIWLGSGITLGSSNSSSNLNCRFDSTWSSGRFKIKGNLVSLLGNDKSTNSGNYSSYTFSSLFTSCSQLTDASELILSPYVSYGCYSRMFESCYNLVTAPELPATKLVGSCYDGMFNGCRTLTTAPELPATTLAYYCYQGMFRGCASLIAAPKLPATTLMSRCYYEMFKGCTSLKYINMQAIDISASYCLDGWTTDVSSTGTFIKNSLATWNVSGVNGIPSEWTVANEIKYLESSGTQWITTDINGQNVTRFIIEGTCETDGGANTQLLGGTDNGATKFFGARVISSVKSWYCMENGASLGNPLHRSVIDATIISTTSQPGTLTDIASNVSYEFSSLAGTFQFPNQTLRIFGGGNGRVSPSARCYGLKLYTTNGLVKDFIPVRVGQVGYMCNKLDGELYGNSGTGDFILGKDIIQISGYEMFDWVQADSTTGVPAIDTGLTPNLSLLWTFEGKFARTDSLPDNYGPTWLFSRIVGGGYECNYALGRYSRYSDRLAFNYNARANSETYSGQPSADINIGEWHTFLLQPSEGISYGGELILDGVVTTYSQSKPNNSNATLKILTANTASNVPYPCRFAEFKVKYDGALVADLIPAKRDTDSVVGFYDIVRNSFHAPSNEGVVLLCGNELTNFTV